jgi:hypothetical protein
MVWTPAITDRRLACNASADSRPEAFGRRERLVRSSVFPLHFTSYNDLSLEYLVPLLLEDERALIRSAEECAERLKDDPEARRIVDKVIVSLRRYAALLMELLAPARVAALRAGENGVSSMRRKVTLANASDRFAQPAPDLQTSA